MRQALVLKTLLGRSRATALDGSREAEQSSVVPPRVLSHLSIKLWTVYFRIYSSGIGRFYVCAKACSKLAYVNPRGEEFISITRIHAHPWRV